MSQLRLLVFLAATTLAGCEVDRSDLRFKRDPADHQGSLTAATLTATPPSPAPPAVPGETTNLLGTPGRPFQELVDFIKQREAVFTKGGRVKGKPWTTAGTYWWHYVYIMQSYVWMYRMTGDVAWLAKFIDFADAAMEKLDSAKGRRDYRGALPPAWQEKTTRFVWVGFTGAMFMSLMDFAYEVQSQAALRDLDLEGYGPLAAKAAVYAKAFAAAAAFHEPQWRTRDDRGFYVFPSDITRAVPNSQALAGQVAPANMQSVMMTAYLHYAKYLGALGDVAGEAAATARVVAFATYLKASVLKLRGTPEKPYYLWRYAPYHPRAEDVGHGNAIALFMHEAYKQEHVIGEDDMVALAGTLSRVTSRSRYVVRSSLINGMSLAGVSTRLHYWYLSSRFQPGLYDWSALHLKKHGYSFVPLVTLARIEQGF